MSDIKLDDNGDLLLQETDLVLTTGQEAIEQHLTQRLRTFLGEWFLNNTIGVAYFQQIFKKQLDPILVDSILKKEIIETPGISKLVDFDLDISSLRVLTLSFRAQTIAGDVINFSEEIP